MKRLNILTTILVVLMVIPASPSTINIPADYPTIQEGVNAAGNDDTVLVQPGTYVENLFLDEQTVVLASLFLTTGDTSYIEQTIIDGNASGTVVTFHYQNHHNRVSHLIGFTIQNGYAQFDQYQFGGGICCQYSNPIIDHNIITNNHSDWAGGGILCWTGAGPVISNNRIFNNIADDEGGGLWSAWSHPTVINNLIYSNQAAAGAGVVFAVCGDLTFSNNLIARNEADSIGSAVWAKSSDILIANSTIVDNTTDISDPSVHISGQGYLGLLNTIVWNNGLPPIHVSSNSNISVSYSDIEDGWTGIGNIDEDPMFCYPDTLNYQLQEDSPCVGTGQSGANIGAYGIGCATVDILEDVANLPSVCVLAQNYPNPFNASTVISYSLPYDAKVKLDIYDIAGRHIETLLNSFQLAERYQVNWNAVNYSSGVYFYKLQVDDFSESRKMFLVK